MPTVASPACLTSDLERYAVVLTTFSVIHTTETLTKTRTKTLTKTLTKTAASFARHSTHHTHHTYPSYHQASFCFYIPLMREAFLAFGVVDASKPFLSRFLEQGRPPHASLDVCTYVCMYPLTPTSQ